MVLICFIKNDLKKGKDEEIKQTKATQTKKNKTDVLYNTYQNNEDGKHLQLDTSNVLWVGDNNLNDVMKEINDLIINLNATQKDITYNIYDKENQITLLDIKGKKFLLGGILPKK